MPDISFLNQNFTLNIFEREMRPLQGIQDNYEKIVLTLDHFSIGNYDGIKVVNVIDWLLDN